MSTHTILGGKVRPYRRGEASSWHCAAYYKGREHHKSTKKDSLEIAQQKAEDWYLELRGPYRLQSMPDAGLAQPLQLV
jgi:hypothetical protein